MEHLISFESGQSLLLRVGIGATLTIVAVPAPQGSVLDSAAFYVTDDVFAIQVNEGIVFILTGLLVAVIPLCSQLNTTFAWEINPVIYILDVSIEYSVYLSLRKIFCCSLLRSGIGFS